MKKIIAFLIVTVFFITNNIQAQDCPKISVSSPGNVKAGEDLVFIVNVSRGKTGFNLTYNWTISNGSIESGQGTSVITLSTKGMGGQFITATVELGGLPPECMRTSSASCAVDAAAPETELHSKGDYTTVKLFTDAYNKFFVYFMSEYYVLQVPITVIYLYPGKNAATTAALKRMTKIIRAAFTKYGMKSTRYRIITGGKRAKTSYEMWIVPEGGKVPVATPAKQKKASHVYKLP